MHYEFGPRRGGMSRVTKVSAQQYALRVTQTRCIQSNSALAHVLYKAMSPCAIYCKSATDGRVHL
jgi:hypothetical protein